MARFVNAVHDRKTLTVQYKSDNGAIFIKSGGSIAWRFNNPGNIRPKKMVYIKGRLVLGILRVESSQFLEVMKREGMKKEHYFVGNTIIIL